MTFKRRHTGISALCISTHMPLARHDASKWINDAIAEISTHMPLARHDAGVIMFTGILKNFYSHASCEA